MNRLDRALGILLLLRSGATVPAAELARRFEVSTRTIYRDIDVLSGVGVPVYAEMGRSGGFRLAEGYFLPPIMFSNGEAAALLVGVAMLRRLRATPFAAELETSARKVLAALPEPMQAAIARAERAIGFEAIPADLLHPERDASTPPDVAADEALRHESEVLSGFLRALLEPATVALRYRSPYAPRPAEATVAPLGLLWDRDRWYLVGVPAGEGVEPRLWRADRVLALRREAATAEPPPFELQRILGRRWLQQAMARWSAEAPVVLALTAEQAGRLADDWYYRHAQFSPLPDGRVAMTFGESDPAVALALLRWLGPGAELLEPREWRRLWREELLAMLAAARDD